MFEAADFELLTHGSLLEENFFDLHFADFLVKSLDLEGMRRVRLRGGGTSVRGRRIPDFS